MHVRMPFVTSIAVLVIALVSYVPLHAQQSPTSPVTATKVWDVYTPGQNCFSQDFGAISRRPGWDRWLLYYGAVTNLRNIPSCTTGGYSEDIYVTWSEATIGQGKVFGQTMTINPPLGILGSNDFAYWCAGQTQPCQLNPQQPGGGDPGSSGWHIGDPAVMVGPTTNTFYMYFDTQD